MRKISLFENFIYENGSQNLTQIIEEIRGDLYKTPVSIIRELVKKGDKDKVSQLKKELKAFTVSGLFEGRPSMSCLKTYNPLIILTISEIDPEILPYLVLKIKAIEFTKAVFKSLKGSGIKVIVEVDSKMDMHHLAFQQVCKFYKDQMAIYISNGGESITELCFISHDPEAYFNPESSVFKITEPEGEASTDLETKNSISQRRRLRRSAKYSPTIPSQVFRMLPALLKKGCEPFADRHLERDVFLTGALGMLSGLLPTMSGVYEGQVQYPNLFVFVIDPASSGKRAFNLSRYLGTSYQKQLSVYNKNKQDAYLNALVKLDMDTKKFQTGNLKRAPKIPTKPTPKNLFPPLPMTPENVIEFLSRNDNTGIMFESETDRLGNTLDKNWGGYSQLLRKAFSHEPIVYNRASDGELINIDHPNLSVALSGSFEQLKTLIPSAGSGLLSRFMLYNYESEETWKDVSQKGTGKNPRIFYEELSEEVLLVINFLKFYPAELTLSDTQWKTLNSTFKKLMKVAKKEIGVIASSLVNQMALNCFKIAMILSAIRKYQEKRLETKLVCHKNDFKTALCLSETYLKHGIFLAKQLPVPSRSNF